MSALNHSSVLALSVLCVHTKAMVPFEEFVTVRYLVLRHIYYLKLQHYFKGQAVCGTGVHAGM
jgi:hypothetical protein